MLSAASPPSHRDLLSAPGYWQGPVVDPLEGLNIREMRAFNRNKQDVAGDIHKSQEIGNLVLSLRGGGTFTAIPEGETIPLPDDASRSVVKIVRDSRIEVPRYLLTPAWFKLFQQNMAAQDAQVDFDRFEAFAEHHASEAASLSGPAYFFTRLSSTKMALIERDTLYMRADQTGQVGVYLTAAVIAAGNFEAAKARLMPLVSVGDMYKTKTGRARTLHKVVSAAVLEATSLVWGDRSGNGQSSENKSRKRVWVPQTAAE